MNLQNCLNENGFFTKNAIDADKADFHLNTGAPAVINDKLLQIAGPDLRKQLNAVTAISELYEERNLTLLGSGEAVITTEFTPLGAAAAALMGFYTPILHGQYHVNENIIEISCPDREIRLRWDSLDGSLQEDFLCVNEQFTPYTIPEVIMCSGAGMAPENWTDTDGTILRDVPYGNRERNLLDVYIPAAFDVNHRNGIILFIHGGSWTSGSKADVEQLCRRYAKLGYFTAAMNHSYANSDLPDGSKVTLLDIDAEVHLAFAKLKELSLEKGWNLTQSALWGFSSGCHVSFLYAYGAGNEPSAPLPVKAVFGMVGSMDFRAEYWKRVTTDGPAVAAIGLNRPELSLLPQQEYDQLIDSISPLAFAKQGDAVPSVTAYATLDPALIDWENGVALQKALDLHGIPNQLILLPNSGHACGNNPYRVRCFYSAMDACLKEYFHN